MRVYDQITDRELLQAGKEPDIRTPWRPMGNDYYKLTGTDPIRDEGDRAIPASARVGGTYVDFRQQSGHYTEVSGSKNPIGWVIAGVAGLFTTMGFWGWFLLIVGGGLALYFLVLKKKTEPTEAAETPEFVTPTAPGGVEGPAVE
jgi:hypothetical protein